MYTVIQEIVGLDSMCMLCRLRWLVIYINYDVYNHTYLELFLIDNSTKKTLAEILVYNHNF